MTGAGWRGCSPSTGRALLAHGAIDAVLDAVELLPRLAPLARDRAARGRGPPGTRRLGRGAALLRPRGRGRRRACRPGSPGAPASCTTSADASTRRSRRTTSPREDGEPRDVALLLAWRASAHWLRGAADECRRDATRAFAIASDAGDPQALAAAHTVLAMLAALEGDRGANDAHYLQGARLRAAGG